MTSPRLAVRALIVEEGRLLLVNAYPDGRSDLWCAPGGGVEVGADLASNLRREVHEETGLSVDVGGLALVNEFHNPDTGFHQVELFFRARVSGGRIDPAWRDPDAIVTERRFFAPDELKAVRFKPDSLPAIAFGTVPEAQYDPLERMII
ncbi:NUDIX hydrolase [Acuticoccus sediminis]|uniref:NUDIX hydrolase n=1 Tax=Acuticoccus sediminis TaxID=2184697 RepID=A0A8B2NVN0_9HYPH|nr:NUDIX hydrolase [Acuticoccus sediminis]RAH99776.1 NUDIX hydrolase [Acuticoccus sediminis]